MKATRSLITAKNWTSSKIPIATTKCSHSSQQYIYTYISSSRYYSPRNVRHRTLKRGGCLKCGEIVLKMACRTTYGYTHTYTYRLILFTCIIWCWCSYSVPQPYNAIECSIIIYAHYTYLYIYAHATYMYLYTNLTVVCCLSATM